MTLMRRLVCNNCSTVYPARLYKCPTKGCRAPRRFSCPETNEALAARQLASDQFEVLLSELAGC